MGRVYRNLVLYSAALRTVAADEPWILNRANFLFYSFVLLLLGIQAPVVLLYLLSTKGILLM